MNIHFRNKNLQANLLLSFILLLCFSQAKAQDDDFKEFEVKTSTITFVYSYSAKTSNYTIWNKEYNEDVIRAKYPFVSEIKRQQVFLQGYRIESESQLASAFIKTFGRERVEELAKTSPPLRSSTHTVSGRYRPRVDLSISFIVNHLGEIQSISYALNSGSIITPEELAELEANLLSMIKFIPLGRTDKPYIEYIRLRINLDDLLQGEVEPVRRYNKRVKDRFENYEKSRQEAKELGLPYDW